MNLRRTASVAAFALLTLCGCLTSSGPAWLEAGRIDMTQYANARVLVLPVEITPPYDLEEGERRAIQDQVKNNLIRTFGLTQVGTLQSVERTRLYPYQLDEMTQIGRLYAVDAVAAISIFSLVRESPDPRSQNNRVGMRVTFTDANDPSRSWEMSREYQSKSGFDADARRFDNTVKLDLARVRDELKSTYGVAAAFRRVDEKPRVTINVPVLGSAFEGDQRVQQRSLATEQSLLNFQILAEDVSGLVRTEVRNTSNGFQQVLEYSFAELKDVELPRRIDESIAVPLDVGENTIEFITHNQRNVTQDNRITVVREKREFVYTLGVGIPQYQDPTFGATPVNSGELKERFERHARALGPRSDNVIFLEGPDATLRAIQRALNSIANLAYSNDQGLGLFYFTGKVETTRRGVYLIAYDSEPGYVEVTGIDTQELDRLCSDNCHTILDLCEPDPLKQRRLAEALPNAQISFDSCTPGQNKKADSLRDQMQRGLPAKRAVQEVFKEPKQ